MTLFQLLTSTRRTENTDPSKSLAGTADIIDPRFDHLVKIYSPKKEVMARINLVLLPKLEKDAIAKGNIFKDIADMDAICHIVRVFEDESVYHVDGSIDPARDIESINSELILHDLIFIEKRVEKLEANIKKIKDETQQKELTLLLKMKDHLEVEKPLRLMDLSNDEESMIRSYPFITLKKMIIALNVSDNDLENDEKTTTLENLSIPDNIELMKVSAKVESEISLLENDEEKQEFIKELGILEPALGILTRLCLKALGLISFFTVGEDEVRQWLLRKNSTAPFAAGIIHSDLQRGFIRAEVMKYNELVECKDDAGLKKAGKIYINGKDYIVEDGDILNIRFKV